MPVIGSILATLFSGVESYFKDDESKAKVKLLLAQAQGDLEKAVIDAQSSIIKEEIHSTSWMAANWRPIMLLSFILIIDMNYIIFPLIRMKFPDVSDIPMPADLWTIIKIGMGGYIPARTIEKLAVPIIEAVKK